MTFRVFHTKRKLDVDIKNGKVVVTIDLLPKVEAEEFSQYY